MAFSLARPHRMYCASNHIIPAISFFNLPFPLFCFTQGPVLAQPGVGYFHTRRPLNAHAKTHTPKAYADNTLIARPSEAYIVCIDMFTTPVATLACRSKHTSLYKPTKKKKGNDDARTRRKTASAFRFIASSSGGAGIGLGSDVVITVVAR